jgi:nucleoside-diphosphate-sugar epimerase
MAAIAERSHAATLTLQAALGDPFSVTKPLAEQIAEDYRKHRLINIITLRPRGFIPYWDRMVYTKYSDWARWFRKGAMHIDDVATAVILSLDLLSSRQLDRHLVLTLDSAYEYTDADLDHWDAEGPGSTSGNTIPNITIWRSLTGSTRH